MNISALKSYIPFATRRSPCNKAEIMPKYKKTTCIEKACSIKLLPTYALSKTPKFIRNTPQIKHLSLPESFFTTLCKDEQISFLNEYKKAGIDLSIIKIGNKALFKNLLCDFPSYLDSHEICSSNNVDSLYDLLDFSGTKEHKLGEIRKLLEIQQVSPTSKNSKGESPFSVLLKSQFNSDCILELIILLFEYGAQFNSDDLIMKQAYHHFLNAAQYSEDIKQTVQNLLDSRDKKNL